MKTCPKCSGTFPSNFSVCPQDATPLRQASELGEGAILRGKYQILARIGEGGMGVVYKARHMRFEEICALKMVSTHLAADEEFLRRFHSEAVMMRRLEHPHALRVHDIDETEDGRPFIVMEYFEGRSLDRLVREEGPLEITRACRIVAQACGALDAAHRLGIVHRDIKPSNILVARTAQGAETAKVFDFGIAKVRDTSELHKGVSLTRTGLLVGTPAYMSPEQAQGARGDSLDGRSDLYSLGIVLFEILIGRLPFQEQTPASLLVAHLQTRPPDPRDFRADLPEPLSEVILRAMEKEPANRFGSAVEMQLALEAISGEAAPSRATLVSADASPSRPAIHAVTQPRTPVPHIATPAPVGHSPTVHVVTPRPAAPAQSPAPGAPDTEQAKTRSLLTKVAAALAAMILLSAIAIIVSMRPTVETPPTQPIKQSVPGSQQPRATEQVPNLQSQSSRITASAKGAEPAAQGEAPTPSQRPADPTPEPSPVTASPAPVAAAPAPRPAAPLPSQAEVPGTVELSGYLNAIAASADGIREIAAAPPGFVDGADFDAGDVPPGFQLVRARHRVVYGAEVMQIVLRSDSEILSVFMAPPTVPMGVGPGQFTNLSLGGIPARKIENPGYTAYVVQIEGSRILLIGKAIRAERMAAILRAFMEGN